MPFKGYVDPEDEGSESWTEETDTEYERE